MSHGLGVMQRSMLFRLARHEIGMAERAAELQRPYRSPDRWSLRSLIYSAAYHQVIARQRAAHDGWNAVLAAWRAGDEANVHARLRKPLDLEPTDFQPHRPSDSDLQRFHPSRAIVGLERRGFVLRDRHRRTGNLALTVEGFAEARRLGGLADSEIVDLDRVQANWRELDDFMLGFTGPMFRDDDAGAIRWAARAATAPSD